MPHRRATVVAAAVLALGGATAVAVGLADQHVAPVAAPADPAAARSSAPAAPVPAAPAPATPTRPATAAPEPAEPVEPAEERAALPVRVRIPAIDVDSPLLHLGLDADGAIAVPAGDDIDLAAWFDGSPRPGEDGPAVIEGHVDSPNGASVFYDLSALEPGHEIQVDREDGSSLTFVVEKVEAYPKDEFPTSRVYANTDGPELRVITCGGDWDPAVGHYEDNTVVFARLA
jgi:sortase (surface protein transpeptidase)